MNPVYIKHKNSIVSTLDGKILELNVEISKEFLTFWPACEFYNYARSIFKSPLYFDAKGNKVDNPQNYEKIKIQSVFLNESSNISAMIYLVKTIKEYKNALDNKPKDADLSKLGGNFSQIHVCVKEEYQKYFDGVFKINCEPPFLSPKMK